MENTERPPAEAGEMLVQRNGCLQCHSLTGGKVIGPSFKEMYGHTFATTDGRIVVADENYIRESIIDPMAAIVAGFEPVMPTHAGKNKHKEISFILSLRGKCS